MVLEGNHANVISSYIVALVESDRGYRGQGMVARKKTMEKNQTGGGEEAAIAALSNHYTQFHVIVRKQAADLPQQVISLES